ncbi:MAG: glucuronate isomerase [Ruminococcaceae bacterium]|nr:glucuronate isomerase [Oscillospiraceae bacterium]
MNPTDLINHQTAAALYDFAKSLPIIDYHNHLSFADIQNNRRFTDIYALWIEPDPYKHRAMRMCGVEEAYITGDADPMEKFIRWCETLPKLIGNPLYTWSRMELERVFGLREMLNAGNADRLWRECNAYLETHDITPTALLDLFGAEYISPCASLLDDVELCRDNRNVAPSLRGDDIVSVIPAFLDRLRGLTHIDIRDLDDFQKAIQRRLDAFQSCGCCFSDHALDNGFVYVPDDGHNSERFRALCEGNLPEAEKNSLSSCILTFLGREYASRGMTMQLHIGAQRYTSTRLRQAAGAAGGYAGIGNSVDICSLTRFLDTLDCGIHGLPKTVLFALNPADNAPLSVLSGSYSRDGVAGLVTQGPAWWWCDHSTGIREVLESSAAFGVLHNFIGMTTDSRSFLSFVRHDYFRRILCSWLGEKVERGEWLCNTDDLRELVYHICYKNAHEIIQKGGTNL